MSPVGHRNPLSRDSISYIKTLLSVQIEKYSIFLGLKNFKILNIHNSKLTLPEVIHN